MIIHSLHQAGPSGDASRHSHPDYGRCSQDACAEGRSRTVQRRQGPGLRLHGRRHGSRSWLRSWGPSCAWPVRVICSGSQGVYPYAITVRGVDSMAETVNRGRCTSGAGAGERTMGSWGRRVRDRGTSVLGPGPGDRNADAEGGRIARHQPGGIPGRPARRHADRGRQGPRTGLRQPLVERHHRERRRRDGRGQPRCHLDARGGRGTPLPRCPSGSCSSRPASSPASPMR